ncbi:MAG: entericidin A/B family lipoprotein [Burkholderiaceae bacterium]|nr:MAG: entericidin A/B family lipoprotein [Burkholderiaceae bacterium]
MKKLFALMGVIVLLAAVAGCNTVKGFGQDLEKVGDKIENKASK